MLCFLLLLAGCVTAVRCTFSFVCQH
uniref:Uncharacterized protein n=1 Tax=Anguilla anguilla TaxID=7936 RepID=A0A0E9PR86_ANGAN